MDVVKLLYESSFDLFDNRLFYANNVSISEKALASVNTKNLAEVKAFTVPQDPPLIGFDTYKTYSIFVLEDEILIFDGSTVILDQDPTFTIIDYCVWWTWLLCWGSDGRFYYVNLEDILIRGVNSALAGDTDFMPVGAELFSVCTHSNFIVFSRTDGYILWTKSLITTPPSGWAAFSTIGFSANYSYVGEPLYLGSYSTLIGINYNVYAINITKIEDSVGMVTKKLYTSFGNTKDICFTSNGVFLFETNALRIYQPSADSGIKETKILFTNNQISPPCKRVYNPTFKVASPLGLFPDYYVYMGDSSKLFLYAYIFNNGDDYYSILFSEKPMGRSRWSSVFLGTWDDIPADPTTWEIFEPVSSIYFYQMAGTGDTFDAPSGSCLNFLGTGKVMTFVQEKKPNSIHITRNSFMWNETYVEEATVYARSYPYAVFRSSGVEELYELEIDGTFLINALTVGDPNAPSNS